MQHLLSGLVCLVNALQPQLQIDLHISSSYIRVIWYTDDCSDVIDFKSFEWSNEEERIRSIQSAILFITECAVADILSKTTRKAA